MSKLPEEFADLERFSDWCLPTEEERYAKRLASSMDEMQELYDAGLARLAANGVGVVTGEMVLFEWLRRAGTEEFRDLLRLIR